MSSQEEGHEDVQGREDVQIVAGCRAYTAAGGVRRSCAWRRATKLAQAAGASGRLRSLRTRQRVERRCDGIPVVGRGEGIYSGRDTKTTMVLGSSVLTVAALASFVGVSSRERMPQ
uniref:Uncharacterized protein n=1 Tax=Arundo donax TaxID=35708 RepID=A0A0A9CEX2_ARUDO